MNTIKKTVCLCICLLVISAAAVGIALSFIKSITSPSDIQNEQSNITPLIPVSVIDSTLPLEKSQPVSVALSHKPRIDFLPMSLPIQQDDASQSAVYKYMRLMKYGDFVYYNQRWDGYKSYPYGTETIGTYGCGPTNIAMVVSTLKEEIVTPIDVTLLAERWGCFVAGAGSSHSIFDKAASYYNVNMEIITVNKNMILQRLRNGEYLICSMGQGFFSRSGHFVVLRGITDNGKILIADSYNESNTELEWDLDFLYSQLRYKKMWAFHK